MSKSHAIKLILAAKCWIDYHAVESSILILSLAHYSLFAKLIIALAYRDSLVIPEKVYNKTPVLSRYYPLLLSGW